MDMPVLLDVKERLGVVADVPPLPPLFHATDGQQIYQNQFDEGNQTKHTGRRGEAQGVHRQTLSATAAPHYVAEHQKEEHDDAANHTTNDGACIGLLSFA
jgi:hypothetical protein